MLGGIGVDIVKVKRFERWLTNPGLLHRFFHERDLEFALSQGVGVTQSLAGRFAAKEAFIKALNTDCLAIARLPSFSFKDIYVCKDGCGKRRLVLPDVIKSVLKENDIDKVHLSISHEKDFAVAVVIIEREES
ncbi:MAG: holo-ACP synthase [Treponema sp.]|jgi:holo-[acyl-carrier protein] synthase|nr:holo-ACP synthase [Treponema sp.]